MNTTLLIIMNPRSIHECIDAIRDLRGVDKAWASYYTETELERVIPEIIDTTAYERYTILSDDVTPTQDALDLVLQLHDQHAADVACGWINVDNTGPYCTINPAPLTNQGGPSLDAYSFITTSSARRLPHTPLRTYFHGMTFATMTREMWHRYPFRTYGGCASDYHQCLRLQNDDVPIWTHPAAGMRHVKETQNVLDAAPEKQLLIGKRRSRVTIETEVAI